MEQQAQGAGGLKVPAGKRKKTEQEIKLKEKLKEMEREKEKERKKAKKRDKEWEDIQVNRGLSSDQYKSYKPYSTVYIDLEKIEATWQKLGDRMVRRKWSKADNQNEYNGPEDGHEQLERFIAESKADIELSKKCLAEILGWEDWFPQHFNIAYDMWLDVRDKSERVIFHLNKYICSGQADYTAIMKTDDIQTVTSWLITHKHIIWNSKYSCATRIAMLLTYIKSNTDEHKPFSNSLHMLCDGLFLLAELHKAECYHQLRRTACSQERTINRNAFDKECQSCVAAYMVSIYLGVSHCSLGMCHAVQFRSTQALAEFLTKLHQRRGQDVDPDVILTPMPVLRVGLTKLSKMHGRQPYPQPDCCQCPFADRDRLLFNKAKDTLDMAVKTLLTVVKPDMERLRQRNEDKKKITKRADEKRWAAQVAMRSTPHKHIPQLISIAQRQKAVPLLATMQVPSRPTSSTPSRPASQHTAAAPEAIAPSIVVESSPTQPAGETPGVEKAADKDAKRASGFAAPQAEDTRTGAAMPSDPSDAESLGDIDNLSLLVSDECSSSNSRDSTDSDTNSVTRRQSAPVSSSNVLEATRARPASGIVRNSTERTLSTGSDSSGSSTDTHHSLDTGGKLTLMKPRTDSIVSTRRNYSDVSVLVNTRGGENDENDDSSDSSSSPMLITMVDSNIKASLEPPDCTGEHSYSSAPASVLERNMPLAQRNMHALAAHSILAGISSPEQQNTHLQQWIRHQDWQTIQKPGVWDDEDNMYKAVAHVVSNNWFQNNRIHKHLAELIPTLEGAAKVKRPSIPIKRLVADTYKGPANAELVHWNPLRAFAQLIKCGLRPAVKRLTNGMSVEEMTAQVEADSASGKSSYIWESLPEEAVDIISSLRPGAVDKEFTSRRARSRSKEKPRNYRQYDDGEVVETWQLPTGVRLAKVETPKDADEEDTDSADPEDGRSIENATSEDFYESEGEDAAATTMGETTAEVQIQAELQPADSGDEEHNRKKRRGGTVKERHRSSSNKSSRRSTLKELEEKREARMKKLDELKESEKARESGSDDDWLPSGKRKHKNLPQKFFKKISLRRRDSKPSEDYPELIGSAGTPRLEDEELSDYVQAEETTTSTKDQQQEDKHVMDSDSDNNDCDRPKPSTPLSCTEDEDTKSDVCLIDKT
eukprot:scpid26531/ scgid11908/ 